jgi:hypothetical protein
MFWDITFIMYKLKFLRTKFPSDQRRHFIIEVRLFGIPLTVQRKGTTHPVIVQV